MEVVRNEACSMGIAHTYITVEKLKKGVETIKNEAWVESWEENHIENKLTRGQIELLQKFGRRPFMNR
jgi:fructose-specific phosphotransferase system component IIB